MHNGSQWPDVGPARPAGCCATAGITIGLPDQTTQSSRATCKAERPARQSSKHRTLATLACMKVRVAVEEANRTWLQLSLRVSEAQGAVGWNETADCHV